MFCHPPSQVTLWGCLRKIFAIFGLPRLLVSDNGPNFVSAEIEDMFIRNGVQHRTSTSYHPGTNGLTERAVKTIKDGMKRMSIAWVCGRKDDEISVQVSEHSACNSWCYSG